MSGRGASSSRRRATKQDELQIIAQEGCKSSQVPIGRGMAAPGTAGYHGTVLRVDAATFDISPAIAEFRSQGYARLGPVVSGEGLAALGARVDDLMSDRVR